MGKGGKAFIFPKNGQKRKIIRVSTGAVRDEQITGGVFRRYPLGL